MGRRDKLMKLIRNYVQKISHLSIPWAVPLAMTCAWIYSTRVELPNYQNRINLQEMILNGTAPEPYRFRILVPFFAEKVETALGSVVLSPEQTHQVTYLILNSTFIFFTLLGLIWHLKSHSRSTQLLAILIMSVALNVALYDHGYQPWTLLELPLVIWAFLFFYQGRLIWIPLITFVAALNRDTGVLLPISLLILGVFFRSKMTTKTWLILFLSTGIALSVFFSIRGLIGSGELDITLEEIFTINMSFTALRQSIFNLFLLLGFGWVILFTSIPSKELLFTMVALVPYAIASAIYGIWYEVRLLLPIVWVLIISIVENLDRQMLGPTQQESGQ